MRINSVVVLHLPTEPLKCSGMKEGRKENALFNDALNTFYLRLYGLGHMIKDHSDSERGNLLMPHGLLFLINSKVLLHAPSHRQDSTYHGLYYTSRRAMAGMRNSSMGPPHEGSIRRPIAPWANALTTELHLAPVLGWSKNRDVKPVPTDLRADDLATNYQGLLATTG